MSNLPFSATPLILSLSFSLLLSTLVDSPAHCQAPPSITRFADASDQLTPPFAGNNSVIDGFGSGAALGDYDNDGRVDIYFPNHGNPSTRPRFLNGSSPPLIGLPTNFIDPEGDGAPNALYRNLGDIDADGLPNFVDVTKKAGAEDGIGIGRSAAFVDLDNDGDLDLYIVNGHKAIARSEFGGHRSTPIFNGFRDRGFRIPFLPFEYDSGQGQFVGEFVVLTDPATGLPRGEGRNTLLRNMLMETGRAVFVDITDEAGDVGGTSGKFPGGRDGTSVAVADVNRDGFVDIYVANFLDSDFWGFDRLVDSSGRNVENGDNLKFNGETNRLYLNDGDMTFTDVTETAGVGTTDPYIYDFLGAVRDPYDPDLTDIAGNPVGEDATHTWAIAFDDFDQDGDADIWVANDLPGTIDLFRNDTPPGAGPDQVKFTSIGRESGADLIGAWMGLTFLDVDHDGVQDVFVTNGGATTHLGPHPTTLDKQTVFSASVFNRFNNNAFLLALLRNDGTRVVQIDGEDQVVGIFPNITQGIKVEPSAVLPPRSLDPTHITPQKRPMFGLGAYEFGFGAVGFDYNNDTNDDLYFVGSLGRAGGRSGFGRTLDQPGRLLMGTAPNEFKDVSVEAHALDILHVNYANVDAGLPPAPGDRIDTQLHEDGRAAVSADLNNDGFPDLVVTNGGGFDSTLPETPILADATVFTPGPAFIFMNEGNDNNWLKVRLVGAMEAGDPPGPSWSNRDAVGAYVRASVQSQGASKSLVRAHRVGASFLGAVNSALHFGLGQADVVSTLAVHWPSGRVDTFENVAANQTITIREAEGAIDAAVSGASGFARRRGVGSRRGGSTTRVTARKALGR